MKKKETTPFTQLFTRLLLFLWAVCCLYPLLFSVFMSFKNNKQVVEGSAWDLPDLPLIWSNYSYTWEKYNFGSYFFNSIFITLGAMLLALILTSTTAYVMARFKFIGSGILYYLYLSSLTIPTMMLVVPMFFLFDDLHISNSSTGLILLYSVSYLPVGLLVLIGFFKSLPHELEESAVVDGASYYRTFFSIMLPLAAPGLITVSILNVLYYWNEFQYALVLLNDVKRYTLPVGLAFMQGEMQYRIEFGPLFAGLMISTIPILVVYVLFQNRINDGIVAGAVK